MKDLFSGAAGRINHHGGSPMFTTPNTLNVPPDYQIETDVPSIAEFITCSLDGRLWVFRRSGRFYVVALRYDELTQEFVAASTIVLNNANFIARGVDWLLTDTTIVQASDDEPYVFTANIFNDSATSFLYSVLRSKELSSGIDPITKQAWGLSETNGNSEGYGYFNRSALLQSVSKHYSLLPAVGDWHIIKNFLVRKVDNPLTDAHNNMLNIRPLIPLEFYGSTPAYGCGFDNDIFISQYNGELWGRGLYHIGRCYILPAVFDESGNPQEFYLYISPDFPRISLTQADKLNLGILRTDDNLYGFLPSQSNSLDNGLCFRSDNPTIFDASTKQWQQISESGQMFIDTLNHSGLVLNDDGATFLNGDSYQCKGLRQWLAPAGVVDAISAQSVISSFDNHALATYPQQGFFREALIGKKLPLSASVYSGKRLSLGCADTDNVKSIHVNSIQTNNGVEAIAWENVYKNAIEIKSLGHQICQNVKGIEDTPVFITNFKNKVSSAWKYDPNVTWNYELDYWFGFGVGIEEVILSSLISFDVVYFNPDIARFETVSTSLNLPQSSHRALSERDYGEECLLQDVLTSPNGFYIEDNKLLLSYTSSYIKWWFLPGWGWEETYHEWGAWHPEDPHGGDVIETTHTHVCANLPASLQYWKLSSDKSGIMLNNFLAGATNFNAAVKNTAIMINTLSSPHNSLPAFLTADFTEAYSNTHFACLLPSEFTGTHNSGHSGSLTSCETINNIKYSQYCNFSSDSTFTDTNGNVIPTEKFHLGIFYDYSQNTSKAYILFFYSKNHTEIFDFKSETERSNLS